MVSNPGSALGEAVGKLFERAIIEGLREEVEARNHTIRPAKLTNGSGNSYQIDAVVFDDSGNPIIIIDPKYIRYTKHNRDKGSWLCVAHYNLRKTYPSIRKSIAVLGGRWSVPSKGLIRSFGVEILEVPFDDIAGVLARWDIDFDWNESDRAAASTAWNIYEKLNDNDRNSIASDLIAGILEQLKSDVILVLETDISAIPHRVSEVEMLLKTDQGEMLLLRFSSIANTLQAMAQLVSDRPDINELLKRDP